MKSTIIFLGLVALTFTTNAKATNEFKVQDLNQQEVNTFSVNSNQQQEELVCVNQEFTNGTFKSSTEDTLIFNPSAVVKSTYTKTVEQVITENKLITETNEESIQPLSISTALVDRIDEDNQIIESTVANEVYPLNFEKINRSVKSNKIPNNNLAVTIDIKL